TYSGPSVLTDGYTFLRSGFALGTSGANTNGTFVGNFAALQLDNVNVTNEVLSLSNNVAFKSTGTSSWTGPIALNGNVTETALGVFTNSGIISGSGALTKDGGGTLIFSGPFANTYTNTTTVIEGTLLLSKSVFDGAIPGPLIIGDGAGGANADVVRLTTQNEINNFSRVTIHSSGWLDLNGNLERIGSLAGNGNVTLGSAHLLIGDDNSSTNFDGVITGTG